MIVDQHFQQRNRLGRLLSLIAQNPSLLGLGVDEDTAGVVGPDGVMEVIGRGSITVVDGAALRDGRLGDPRPRPLMISSVVLDSLPAGYRFDLRRRTRVAAALARHPGRRRLQLILRRRRRCLARAPGHAGPPAPPAGRRAPQPPGLAVQPAASMGLTGICCFIDRRVAAQGRSRLHASNCSAARPLRSSTAGRFSAPLAGQRR